MHGLELPVIALGDAVLHFLWQGAAIALLAGIALAVVSRTDSAARHVIGVGALLLSLITFTGTFVLGLAEARAPEGSKAVSQAALAELPLDVLLASFTKITSSHGPRMLLAWAWMAGALLMGLRLLRGQAWARGLRRVAFAPEDPTWQQVVDSLCDDLGLRRAVRLLQSARIESPAVIGWLEPVIVVPVVTLTGLTPGQLRCVLAHELAHVRRHDHIVNALMALVEVALFFHPATWWLAGLVRREREHCCDLAALRATGNPRLLAEALTELESVRISEPTHALAARSEGAPLMGRIIRILAMNRTKDARDGGRRFRAVVILASALAGAGFVQSAIALPAPAAVPVWSAGPSQDPESEYRIIEKRILAAVESGHLSREDAGRTLEAIRREMKIGPRADEHRKRGGKRGRTTREDYARAKANRQRDDERPAEYEAIERKIHTAVRAGRLSREEAGRKLAEARERVFPERGEARREARHKDPKAEYRAGLERIKAAVARGKISREDADRRIEEMERASKERVGAGGERGDERRAKYEAIEKKIAAAVRAGKLSRGEAGRKLAAVRERMFPERAGEKHERRGFTVEEYRRAEAELRELVEAGKLESQGAERRLIEMRKRIVAEREDPDPERRRR